MHGDDIGIPFHEVALIFFYDALPGLEDAVEDVTFVVYVGLGGVEVLGNFPVGLHHPATEGYHLAGDVMDGEHDPAGEPVEGRVVVVMDGEACFDEEFKVIPFFEGLAGEMVALLEAVAQLELFYGVVAEATFLEVGEAYEAPFLLAVQVGEEGGTCKVCDNHHALAVGLLLNVVAGLLCFDNFNMVLGCKVFKSLVVVNFFMFHNEIGGVAAFAAAKTFVDVTGGRHGEGRCFFIMKRTQADEVDTPAPEGDKILHHFNNTGGVENTVYCVLVDHLRYFINLT